MKRGKRALILAGVLAVLVLVYVGVQKGVSSQPEAVTEESGSYPLTSHTAEELTSLQWTSGDGEEQETFHFVKTDGQWRVEGDEAFPVKQDSVEGLAETLTALKADRKLENVEKPEDYGLLEPAFTLTAGWSDGTETVYSMGDETPFGDGHYLSLSGEDGTVYTVADALSGDFSGSLLSFAQSEELPAVENVTRLVVGDTLDVEGTAEKTEGEGSSLRWTWKATGEKLDGSEVEALIDEAKNLSWTELKAVNADDEALSGYGLTDEQATAITLYDGETIVWKLLAGAEADEGGHYVRLPDSAMVYTADVDALLEADIGSLYDPALTDLNAEDVSTISVKAGEQVWEFAAASAEETEETVVADSAAGKTTEGEETSSDETSGESGTETSDEENTEPARWEQLFEKLSALQATGRVTETAGTTPVLEAQIVTVKGEKETFAFFLYDESSYLMPINETTGYLFSADKVDQLLRTLRLWDAE
mgnify:FL=1